MSSLTGDAEEKQDVLKDPDGDGAEISSINMNLIS